MSAQALYRPGSRTRYNNGKRITWRRIGEIRGADAANLSLVQVRSSRRLCCSLCV